MQGGLVIPCHGAPVGVVDTAVGAVRTVHSATECMGLPEQLPSLAWSWQWSHLCHTPSLCLGSSSLASALGIFAPRRPL